jgi:hypothetical protein
VCLTVQGKQIMDEQRSSYCRTCGAPLTPESVYCEYCGAQAEPAAPSPKASQEISGTPVEGQNTFFSTSGESAGPQIEVGSDHDLPDVDVPPRVGRAISIAWEILMQDVVGGIVVALIFFAISIGISLVLPFANYLIIGILQVGFLSWAAERRRGIPSGIGTVINVSIKKFPDAILVGLLMLGIGLIIAIPLLIAYFSFFSSIINGMFIGHSTPGPPMPPTPSNLLGPIGLVFGIIWALVLGIIVSPALYSFQSLALWAIVQDRPFKEACSWAWARVKKNYFGWWLAGIEINFIAGMGALACYIGVLFTFPLAMLAWAEVCGDKGDDG